MQAPLLEYKQVVITNALRHCELFREPSQVDLQRLASIVITKTIAKGEYLFHENDTAHGFFMVHRGAISLHRVGTGGREQILRIMHPFETFAEESLFSDSGYQAHARAMEPSQVLLIPKPEFLALTKRHPEMALRMLRVMSRHLSSLLDLLESLRLKDVKTRVAAWFVEHCPDPLSYEPCDVEIATTKRVVASELGIASETFSRVLRKLQEADLVTVHGNLVTLLCPMKLTQMVEENHDPEFPQVRNGRKIRDRFSAPHSKPRFAMAS